MILDVWWMLLDYEVRWLGKLPQAVCNKAAGVSPILQCWTDAKETSKLRCLYEGVPCNLLRRLGTLENPRQCRASKDLWLANHHSLAHYNQNLKQKKHKKMFNWSVYHKVHSSLLIIKRLSAWWFDQHKASTLFMTCYK